MKNRSFRCLIAAAALLQAPYLTAQEATAPGAPCTIAVTGDINAGPSTRLVSDLILAVPEVQAVLLVGDTQNSGTATMEKYRKIYMDTYDRFRDRLYPVPGNHDWDRQEPRIDFSSYIAFWKEKARAPELYYSFDLGGWHIIGLDSMTFLYGRDSRANERQLAWLKQDLASRPGMPVIAFWHVPAFSSARHGGRDELRKHFCRLIHEHGPALIFCGHTHVYERYVAMGPCGEKAAPERGLHHFTIGPGGSKPEKEQKPDAEPPLPAVFHGGAQHVGFFTLSPGGNYRFVIKAVDDAGQVSEVDAGAGTLKETVP